MIDVRHPKCIGCNLKRPNFNLPTDTTILTVNKKKIYLNVIKYFMLYLVFK